MLITYNSLNCRDLWNNMHHIWQTQLIVHSPNVFLQRWPEATLVQDRTENRLEISSKHKMSFVKRFR